MSGPTDDPVADSGQRWPVSASVDLFRDAWVVALRADTVHRPGADDEPGFRRLVLEHPGAAVILAADAEERVLCLWQYRHPAGRRFVELPAGLLDGPVEAGRTEEPLDVAVRELREEAELEAGRWRHLLSTYPSPGITAEVQHLFLAGDLTRVDRGDFELRHEEADMDAAWVPFADLLDGVLAGRVSDGPVAQAVLATAVLGGPTAALAGAGPAGDGGAGR